MDFKTAVRDYQYAAMRFALGYIDRSAFLNEAACTDDEYEDGKRWRIDPGTDTWQLHEQGAWKAATPPGLDGPEVDRYYMLDSVGTASPARWIIGLGLLFSAVVFIPAPESREQPFTVMGGMLLVMAVTWLVSRRRSSGSWSGTVEEIYLHRAVNQMKTRKKRYKARVRLDGGGEITIDAMPSWKEGDRLRKIEGLEMPLRSKGGAAD